MKKRGKNKNDIESFILKDYEKTKNLAVLVIILIFVLAVGVFSYFNTGYTGLSVFGDGRIVLDETRDFIGNFEKFEINKIERSSLDVIIKSDVLVDVFVKKRGCDLWSDEKDVLMVIESISDEEMELGKRRGGWADREIYKEDTICLIVYPVQDFDFEGNIKVIAKERM